LIKNYVFVQNKSMDIYFVTVGKKYEVEVIKECKPKSLLLSYFHFGKREKILRLLDSIGYKPNILLDSGAYSAMTTGKEVALTAYMKFVKDNQDLVNNYIALDVFEKENITKAYYDIMKEEGLNPIPVFHYGFSESLLSYYIDQGETYIAFGGTVGIANKSKVAEWVKYYCWLYPGIKFHLLGSTSHKIMDNCDLESVDASSWILRAVNGEPKHIHSKKGRMEYIMRRLMEYEGITHDS
jgi:hypothetical protein